MDGFELKKAEEKHCALCNLNGSSKKRIFYLYGGQKRLLVCSACIISLGSGLRVQEALEKKFPKLDDGRESRFYKGGVL